MQSKCQKLVMDYPKSQDNPSSCRDSFRKPLYIEKERESEALSARPQVYLSIFAFQSEDYWVSISYFQFENRGTKIRDLYDTARASST